MQPDYVLNMVPRKILGSKRDEVERGWRKLRNEGPNILYSFA
jgi:hypothetical protein